MRKKALLAITLAATMLVAGVGPFLSWKRAKPREVARKAGITTIVALIVTSCIALVWRLTEPVGLFGLFIAIWLAAATSVDLARRAGFPGAEIGVQLRRLAGLPRSAWSLYIGHLGVAVAAAGVIAVSVYQIFPSKNLG